MRRISRLIATAAAALALSVSAHAQVTLKASHQFPGGKGDVRDDMVQMVAQGCEGRQCRSRHPGLPRAHRSSRRTSSGTRIVGGQLDLTLVSARLRERPGAAPSAPR